MFQDHTASEVRAEFWMRSVGSAVCGKLRPANVLSLSRHVPSRARGATQRVAPDEPRKRRADERHVVGCCEELGRFSTLSRYTRLMAEPDNHVTLNDIGGVQFIEFFGNLNAETFHLVE